MVRFVQNLLLCTLSSSFFMIGLSTPLAQQAPTDNDIVTYRKLQAAAYRNDAERVSQFVDEGDDLEKRDDGGRTPLLIAAHQRSYKTIESLVSAGADPNAVDNEGYGTFAIGVAVSDNELTDLASNLGTKVDGVSGVRQDTQLGHAARNANIPLLELMIKLGAEVNFVNGEEDTPLISAVKYGDGSEIYQKMVQILMDAGARNGKKDANGQRARQIARERGYDVISAIIKEG